MRKEVIFSLGEDLRVLQNALDVIQTFIGKTQDKFENNLVIFYSTVTRPISFTVSFCKKTI